jgi:hypothetical protein
MELRTYVTFEAEGFPDEARWSDNGSPLIPDGQSVAGAIVRALREAGLPATDPIQHQFYGWAFDVSLPGGNQWCLLQYPGPWLLLVRQKCSVLGTVFSRKRYKDMATVVHAIDRVLKRDGRFLSVLWFTETGYESGTEQGEDVPM